MQDKNIALQRGLLTQKIRNFFNKQGFLEVETPIMTPIPGMEPHLTPFETKLIPPSNLGNHKQIALYLNTSPELQMKKLLGADFGNIFQITKVFRNCESESPLHNPEFTMLEWYRENADYTDLMTDCENLILELVKINRLKFTHVGEKENKKHNSQLTIYYQSQIIDLTPPWPRFSTNELFQKYCHINLLENQTFKDLKKTVDKLSAKNSQSSFVFDSSGCVTWDDLYFKIFLNHIEPRLAKLNQPFFIYDYPSSQAALAKKSSKNPFFAERFELYIKGTELANAFSELTNSKEQRQRLQTEQNLRKKLGKTVFPIDEEFLQALDQIKKTCAGIALGLDRLFMLLLDKKSISEVLLFPISS